MRRRPAIPSAETYYRLSEVAAALAPAARGAFERGDRTEQLERVYADYVDMPSAYALSSARLSFYYTLRALELPAGSEVLMTPIGIADFVSMVRCNGLTPGLVEMDAEGLNYDVDALRRAITKQSRVLLLTYLYGLVPYNLPEILELAAEHGLVVVEDISQSLGATYQGRKLGTVGDVGICSLSSFKTVSSLFGGMVTARDESLLARIRRLSEPELHAPPRHIFLALIAKIMAYKVATRDLIFDRAGFEAVSFVNRTSPRLYEILLTGNVSRLLGFEKIQPFDTMRDALKFRFTDFQADLALAGLARLDAVNGRLASIARRYEATPGIEPRLPRLHPESEGVYWRFPVRFDDVAAAKAALFARRVQTSLDALHLFTDHACFDAYARSPMPGASAVHLAYLLLPIHAGLSEQQVDVVADALAAVARA